MTDTTPFRPLIRTQADDLQRVWERLLSPLGFSGQSIWILVIDSDDHPLPQVTEITEAELDDGIGPEDRSWAALLYAAARLADVPVEVVHRASDHDLVPIPFDEVLGESA